MDLLVTQVLHANCTRKLEERFTVHRLYDAPDEGALLDRIGPSIRAVAGGNVDPQLLDRLPRLEIISTYGVGYDSVDVAAARQRSIRVTNTPGVLNDAVAEMTIALMLALARRIPHADRFVREGRWPLGHFPLQEQLKGRRLGIIGLGRIGKAIAALAEAFKMTVVYHGRNQQPDVPYRFYGALDDMAREVEWLVVIAPGGKSTEGIVSRRVLQALGPKGRLVNMARGSLVDQDAMIELLRSGELGGAALDVFTHEPVVPEPLLGLATVVLSPHQGSATTETRDAMGDLLVANLVAHFEGRPLLSAVV